MKFVSKFNFIEAIILLKISKHFDTDVELRSEILSRSLISETKREVILRRIRDESGKSLQ